MSKTACVLNSVSLYLKVIGSNSTGGNEDNLSLGTDSRKADHVKKLESSPAIFRYSKERTLLPNGPF